MGVQAWKKRKARFSLKQCRNNTDIEVCSETTDICAGPFLIMSHSGSIQGHRPAPDRVREGIREEDVEEAGNGTLRMNPSFVFTHIQFDAMICMRFTFTLTNRFEKGFNYGSL